MKKLIFLCILLLSSIIPIQGQTRMTLSEAYAKDEQDIHARIQKEEQNYLKYPLTYQSTKKWITKIDTVFIKINLYPQIENWEHIMGDDWVTLYRITADSLINKGWIENIRDNIFVYYHPNIFSIRKILTHIFIGKTAMGIPVEMYSQYYIFENGDIEKIIIDEYIRP